MMASRRSRHRRDKRQEAAELQRTDEPPLSMSMLASREDYARAAEEIKRFNRSKAAAQKKARDEN